jgi:hypothetical protein
MVLSEFLIDIIPSKRSEYQEYFLGVKGGRCITLTTFMCWFSGNYRSLNFLEPSGPVQVCTGIALPLWDTVECATKNECYNEEFLSIKSGWYNKHRWYNERGGILFIMESSIIIFTRKRSFKFFMRVRLFMLFIRESLFIVFTKARLFMLFKFTRTVYKS